MERVCESCGGDDEELVLVRGRDAGTEDAGGDGATELWCAGCRAERAHEVVDDRT